MDFIRVTAKTIDEAITKALIQLETTSDNIEYTVIEKGSSGILGMFGAKPAIIEVKRKKIEEEPTPEAKVIEKVSEVADSIEKTQITNDSDYISMIESRAVTFLDQVFHAMDIKVNIETSYNEETKELSVDLNGENMGILIGKRGKILDSLQYLLSLVVKKETNEYIRVKLDTENYRERRKETLEKLAKNIAFKVKRTKHSVPLEVMNPYERRIIHAALQNDKDIVTRSEGEEPYRYVVVSLKRDRR